MGDVGFGVELVLAVDAALDLAGSDALDDGGNASEEVVLEFLALYTGVQGGPRLGKPFGESLLGSKGDFLAHQDVDGIDLLPPSIEGRESTNLEVTASNIDGLRDLTPVVKVAANLPVLVAVVHDVSRFSWNWTIAPSI